MITTACKVMLDRLLPGEPLPVFQSFTENIETGACGCPIRGISALTQQAFVPAKNVFPSTAQAFFKRQHLAFRHTALICKPCEFDLAAKDIVNCFQKHLIVLSYLKEHQLARE